MKGVIAAETRQEMTISSQNVPQNAAPFSSQNYELEDQEEPVSFDVENVHTPTLQEVSEPFQICSQDLANCLQTQVGMMHTATNKKDPADTTESFK